MIYGKVNKTARWHHEDASASTAAVNLAEDYFGDPIIVALCGTVFTLSEWKCAE